jgi:ribose-phosphate pyrophosphokinase
MNLANPLSLIAMPGTEEFACGIEAWIREWNQYEYSLITSVDLIRFSSGDGKAVINESIRGKDVFIISDPYNYSITYNIRNKKNHMSPDDHFQNIKRILSAINGKANSISVLMNMLYSSRQHDRKMRESLDCAVSLQELAKFGLKSFITFDAHDPKIQNAVPAQSFDNLYPYYQMLKSLVEKERVIFSPSATLVVSTDAGGIQRCLQLADVLGLDIGAFYKVRNTKQVAGGKNEIVDHKYMGRDVNNMDIIIVDDILSSGESLLDSFKTLKALGARRIYAFITFALFLEGYDEFDKYHKQNMFDQLFITDLTYREPIVSEKPYISIVCMSKYAAYVIDSIHKGKPISSIIDPNVKIRTLVEKYNTYIKAETAKSTAKMEFTAK